uniref:diguanylate cyclase n=1 Tax=Magnetococcus massalia (strain MO-1) TaxID=451514 RepID=A0A1S7LQQ6_MAGMO|nr:Protein of unknown function. putative GGDEF domain/pas/pac sensor domain protein [Candidatus Magnetococcus massalia]
MPFLIGMVLIGLLSLGTIYTLQSAHQETLLRTKLTEAQAIYQARIDEEAAILHGYLTALEVNENLQTLFTARNRATLLAKTQSTYQQLNQLFGITHLYFIKPDKRVFLRVHKPTKRDDLITRHTLLKTVRTQKSFHGVEFGMLHHLTLRVVHPWIVNGELLGYLELGKEVDHLLPMIKRLIDADLTILVNKQQLHQQFGSDPKLYRQWKELARYYAIGSTMNPLPEGINQFLQECADGEIWRGNFGYSTHAGSIPLQDAAGIKIGKIMVVTNSHKSDAEQLEILLSSTLFIAIIVLLMYAVHNRYALRLQEKLDSHHKQLEALSICDELTRLYNRRYFNNVLPTELQRLRREGGYLLLLIMDVDHFKAYNDHYGHPAGDEVLARIGKVLRETLQRGGDYTFRIGGEEFSLLCRCQSKEEGAHIAERVRRLIERLDMEHLHNGPEGRVTLSVGGVCTQGSEDVEYAALYKQADTALYRAKEAGRNRVELA